MSIHTLGSFHGYDFLVDETMPIGRPAVTDTFVLAHPLDLVAMAHAEAPHARMDAAMAYLVESAMSAFDVAEWLLGQS